MNNVFLLSDFRPERSRRLRFFCWMATACSLVVWVLLFVVPVIPGQGARAQSSLKAPSSSAVYSTSAVQPSHTGPFIQPAPAQTREITWGWQWRGAAGSAGDMPFWLHSNRFGALDRYSYNTTFNLFGSWRHTFDSGVRVSAGADLLFRGAGDAIIWFQEGYVQAGYGHFVLRAGRKREDFGLLHPELTMGTVDLSHNARPMPKIVFSTDGWKPIPGTRRVFYYDASLAHGWMEDSGYRYVDGVLLHQKHLYLRMFTEDSPVYPRAGLKHFAQWWGTSPVNEESNVNMLRAYQNVFFSRSADNDEILGRGELLNRFQNHVGSYDFALMLNLGRYKMGVSRQFILEDNPNARFGTPWDGLWGAYFELRPDSRTRWRSGRPSDWPAEHRPLLKAVNYEHLNTINGVDRMPHRDMTSYYNYYNHWAYRGGWAYYGRAIGNPLFFSHPDYLGVINNLMLAHHVGAMGYAGPVDWRFFTTYSRNYGGSRLTTTGGGRVSLPNDRRDQWSMMLEMKTNMLSGNTGPGPAMWMRPIQLTVTLGYDTGDVYPENFGVMIGVRWEGGR
ncbi:MAG: capsule assembly Wzi family protein [Balneolales bacterium]